MCLLQNACFINGSLTLFLPPPYSQLQSLGFFDFPRLGIGARSDDSMTAELMHDSFLWKPTVLFEPMPQDVRFATNITHFLFQKIWHRSLRNFGHIVFEYLAGIYHAMEMFNLISKDGRMLLFLQYDSIEKPLYNTPRELPIPLFPRKSAFLEEYPSGTCFRRVVVGATSVTSLFGGWSYFRASHIVRFRQYYLQTMGLEQSVSPTRQRKGLVVNFYPRVIAGTHSTWSDVCKLSGVLAQTFPDAEFRCIVLHTMSVRVQVQLISEAVVHVWPHGNTRLSKCCLVLHVS